MISIEQAEQILDKQTFRPEVEEVPLMESMGRVLGRDVVSSIHMPPFDKSAMDGYAIISTDHSPRYQVIETIAAGSVPQKTVQKGQCAKIMTGAMLPPGADRVVKVEVTQEKDGCMSLTGEDPNLNICYLGEDIKPGAMVLDRGHLIRPPEVGIIASMGMDRVPVYKKPLVGIVTTGDEIVAPGQELGKGQIYNSNAYSIAAQVMRTGADVTFAGIVEDHKTSLAESLSQLLDRVQMVLISGGVSMGDYDYVPGILKEIGVQLHFYKVAVKPGKPTVFGTRGNTVVFGLPGNPVSTFTIFEIFARKILYRLMGHEYTPVMLRGEMKFDYHRKRTERTAYVPVVYNAGGTVETLAYHGSAHLAALARADGLLKVPAGQAAILKGTPVYVRQI